MNRPIFGLVRDKNGVPLFDSPETADPELKAMLTDRDLMLMSEETVAKLGMTSRLKRIQMEAT